MNIEEIKTGDIYLVKSNSFLSKAIRWFMKLYAKKFKIVYNPDKIYSHAATLVWIDDILYIAESVDNGFHLRIFDRHYDLNPEYCTILTPIKSYDESEIHSILHYSLNLATVSQVYQYWNFIQWPLYILSNKKINLFGKGKNRGITYCYESTQMIKQEIRPYDYKDSSVITDFFTLYNDPNFKIIL